MSRAYAEEAKQSATHMENIAFRTANERASMHIITVVTLYSYQEYSLRYINNLYKLDKYLIANV